MKQPKNSDCSSRQHHTLPFSPSPPHYPHPPSHPPQTMNDARLERVQVQGDTLRRLTGKDPKPVIPYCLGVSECYTTLRPEQLLPRGPSPHVEVVELDTFVAADVCVRRGDRVAVLNMASAVTPGGGYLSGAPAQEEDLCRRSDMAPALERAYEDGLYCIPDRAMFVVPDVDVFKGPRPEYALLSSGFKVGVLVAAAYCCPPLTADNRLPDVYARSMKEKMKLLLAAAYVHGYTTLVLGAWGCGAFGNPPQHIAELFKEVLESWGAAFPRVTFAIVGDGNAEVFARVFGK